MDETKITVKQCRRGPCSEVIGKITAEGKCKECERRCKVTLYDLDEDGYAWLCDKCAHGERL